MRKQSLRQRLERKCVHFNGLQHEVCKAGCVYNRMDEGKRIAYRSALPCFKPDEEETQKLKEAGVEQATCNLRRFPTNEEIEAEEKRWSDRMAKMNLALSVIKPIREEHKGKNWQGVLECPVCKGKLYVTHAGYNGHVHVRCETPDCVAWME